MSTDNHRDWDSGDMPTPDNLRTAKNKLKHALYTEGNADAYTLATVLHLLDSPIDYEQKRTTPIEFHAKMLSLAAEEVNDPEAFHCGADDLMCDLLRELGFEKAVAVFEHTPKY